MRAWQQVVCVVAVALWGAACGDSGDDGAAGSGGDDGGTGEPGAIDPPAELDSWVTMGGTTRSTFHNPGDQGVSADNVASLTPDYKLNTVGGVSGTPVLVDGTLYVSSQASIYAADPKTGEEKWRSTEWGALSSLAYADGVLYAHANASNAGGANLAALNPEDGSTIWSVVTYDHPGAYPYSSPIVAENLIIVGTSGALETSRDLEGLTSFKGNVAAFDKDTGAEVWRFWTTEPDSEFSGATIWSSVSIDLKERLVLVTTGNNYYGEDSGTSDSLFALELDTGKQVWHRQLKTGDVWSMLQPGAPDHDFGTNPIVFDWEIDGEVRKLVAAGQKSGSFWLLDRLTGDVVWETVVLPRGSQSMGGVLNNGAFDGKRLYASCNDPQNNHSRLVAMDPTTGDVVWEQDLGRPVMGPVSVHNGVLFVPNDKALRAFDTEEGTELASFAADGTISSGTVVFDGQVFFGNGTTYFGTTAGSDLNVLKLP